ncbi:MAG: hypothetical protein ACJ72E_08625 [Marmoricola sp.]
MSDEQPPGRIKDISVYRNSFIGMILIACDPFLIFGALKVYGWWAAIGMFLVWFLLLASGARRFMTNPTGVIRVGVVGFAMWLAVVVLARLF